MQGDVMLRRTKKLLLEQGWCQGRYQDTNGAHCLLGAMMTISRWRPSLARTAAVERLVRDLPSGTLPDWNDTKGRTLGEVIALIDRTLEQPNSSER